MDERWTPSPDLVNSQTARAATSSHEPPEQQQAPHHRTASRPAPLAQQQQLKDAVNTAFDQAPTTDQLDPDFLKRLTEHVTDQVIRNLQAVNIGGPTPPPSFHSHSAHPTNCSPSARSPLRSSTDSFPPQFTPPSPHQERHGRDVSPERAPSDDGSNYSGESGTSHNSFATTQSNRETAPLAAEPFAIPGLRRSKTTAADEPIPMAMNSQRKPSGRDAVRDSKDSETPIFNEPPQSRARPATVSEGTTEATTLEKIWQPLFVDGNPTMRMGQFLRGLAKHIIDDYEPRNSLVITPPKMLQFLNETKTADEHYPWSTIFGGQLCANSISVMYRKLLCQHHFVQLQVHEGPTIPSLTPLGFETFMTCLIQAHPDTEFARLAKAVREMPISNADHHRERFPKELSRRLLPAFPSMPAEQRIISSLAHEPVLVPLERGISAMPPPPPSAPPLQSAVAERERNPYSQSSNAVDDDDLTPLCLPLERERKPYSAKEGTGKRYDTGDDRDRDRIYEEDIERSRDPNRSAGSKYRAERSEYTTRPPPQRNPGAPPQAMFNRNATTDPTPIPPPNRKRMSSGPLPPRPSQKSSSYSRGSRRSPPPTRAFGRSEPTDVNSIPQSQYTSNLHPGQPRDRYPVEVEGDASRYSIRRPSERNINYTNDDDPNGRPIPPRNVPTGSSGYPRNGLASSPPVNSFPSNVAGIEDRRRTWYPGMTPGSNPGGTDGYGSGLYGSSAQN